MAPGSQTHAKQLEKMAGKKIFKNTYVLLFNSHFWHYFIFCGYTEKQICTKLWLQILNKYCHRIQKLFQQLSEKKKKKNQQLASSFHVSSCHSCGAPADPKPANSRTTTFHKEKVLLPVHDRVL